MKESSTYQAIVTQGISQGIAQGIAQGISQGIPQGIAQGIPQGARALLLHLGEKRFGPPDQHTRAAIAAMGDLDQLEKLSERLLEVSSWSELLRRAKPRRRNGSRRTKHNSAD